MAADDFTLQFGSNAKQFARDLDRELAPVLRSIESITESVKLFQAATNDRREGSGALVEQLSGISKEIKEQALEARKDVGATTQAMKAAASAITSMQGSIQGLLQLFNSITGGIDQAEQKVVRGNQRLAGLRRNRQQFQEEEKNQDSVLGLRGTANPFSRRTSGLSEGLKHLGEVTSTAGAAAREGAQGVGALRDALRGMVRALPAAVDSVEKIGSAKAPEISQLNLTSDLLVGLAQAIRDNTSTLRGDIAGEAQNTEATRLNTAETRASSHETVRGLQFLSKRDLDNPAKSGRFEVEGEAGSTRKVGFDAQFNETFRQYFARAEANLEAEKAAMRGIELRSAQSAKLLEAFSRKEIDRLRDREGVIQPSQFEKFRATSKGLSDQDVDRIPAALADLAREEKERDAALQVLIRAMLKANPGETFAGMSAAVKSLVQKLDTFIIRQVNQRDDLLEKGQVGNSRFRARGVPSFDTPEELAGLHAGAVERDRIRGVVDEFVARMDARIGGSRDADLTGRTGTREEGTAIGLRARQKAIEKSEKDIAAFTADKEARKTEIARREAARDIRIAQDRAEAIRAAIAAADREGIDRNPGQTRNLEEVRKFQQEAENAVTGIVSDLRTKIDRLNARTAAVRTNLDDSPDAQKNAQRRVSEIDRQRPAVEAAIETAKAESEAATQIRQQSAVRRDVEKKGAKLQEDLNRIQARRLQLINASFIGPRLPSGATGPAAEEGIQKLNQARARVEELVKRQSARIQPLYDAEAAAHQKIIDKENQLYALIQERVSAMERAARGGTLTPDQQRKLEQELASLTRRRVEAERRLQAVNPIASQARLGTRNQAGATESVSKTFKSVDDIVASLSAALALVEADIDAKVAKLGAADTLPQPKGKKTADRTVGRSQAAAQEEQASVSVTRAKKDEEASVKRKVAQAKREVRDAEQRSAKAQVIIADDVSSEKDKNRAQNRLTYATDQLAKARLRLAQLEDQQAKAKKATPAVRTGGGSGKGGFGSDGTSASDPSLPRGKGPVDVRIVSVSAEAARALGRAPAPRGSATQGPEDAPERTTPVTPRVTANARQTIASLEQIDAEVAVAASKSLDTALKAGKDQVELAKAMEQRMLDALRIVESLRAKGLRTDAAIRVAADSVGFGRRTPERAQFTQFARTQVNLSSATREAQELQKVFDALPQQVRADLLKVQRALDEGLVPRSVVTQELVRAYRQFVSSPLLAQADITRVEIKRMFGRMFQIPPGVVSDIARTVAKANAGLEAAGGEAGSRFSRGFQRFVDKTFRAGSFFSVRSLAGSFVFGLENVFREAFTTALNAETEFVRVEEAMRSAGQSAQGLKGEFQSLSRELGVPLDDIQRSASQLVGVFNDRQSLIDATRTVAELQIISNGALDATEGFKSLTAVASAFGLRGAKDLEHIADIATALQNTLGTNVEDTLEGVSRLGAVATQYGLKLEQIAALTATASKFTGLSGQTVSEQLGRVLSLFNTPKVQQLLTQTFKGKVTQDQFQTPKGTGEAITTLIRGFNDLDQTQKATILHTLGGSRQFALLSAVLTNSSEAMRAMEAAENSQGAAASRIAKIMQTLRKEIDQLKASLVTLIAALADAGLFGALEIAAKAAGALFSTIASVVKVFNDMTDNPVLGFIKSLTVSILLLAAAYKIAKAGANFFKQGVQEGAAGTAVANAAARTAAATQGGGLVGRSGAVNVNRVATTSVAAGDSLRNVASRVEGIGVAGRTAALGLSKAAGATDALARAASVTGGRLDAVSEHMEKLNASGAVLDGALLGITIVMASYLSLLAREDALRKSIVQAIKDRQSHSDPKSEAEKKKEQADEFLKEAQDQTDGFFNTVGLGLSGIVKIIKSGGGSPFAGKRLELDRALANGSAVEDVENFNGALDKFLKTAQKKLAGKSGQDKAQVAAQLANELQAQQDELVGLVGDNPVILAKAFSVTTQIIDDLRAQAAGVAVGIKGFGQIAAVTQDQLDNLSGLTSALAGLNPGQLAAQAGNIAEILSETDIGTDPKIRALVTKLTDPKLTGPERSDIKTQLLQAMADFQLRLAQTAEDVTQIPELLGKALTLSAEAAQSALDAQKQKFDNLRRRAENQTALGRNDTAAKTFAQAIAANRRNSAGVARGTDEFAQFVETDKELRKSMAEALYADALAAAKTQAATGGSDKAKRAGEAAVNAIELKIAEAANDIPGLLKRIGDAEIRLAFKRERQAASAAAAAVPPDVTGPVRSALTALQTALDLKDPTAENLRTVRLREAQLAQSVAVAAEQAAQEGALVAGTLDLMNKSVIAAGKKVAAANAKVRAAGKLPKTPKIPFPNQPAVPDVEIGDLQNQGSGDDAKDKNDLAEQIRQARSAARIAGIRNPLAKLQAELNETLRQQQVARAKGREGLPDYYRLVAEEKQLRQQIGDTISEIASAEKGLAIAIADAAGRTVRSARLRLADARRQARRARRLYGAGSAEFIQAQQQVVQLQASARDAALQDSLDTIDFNLEFDKINATQAIAQLQNILKQKDLTKQQRRDLLRKIKSIQDEINSSNEGQFNIGDILLPTIYEVRRSAKAAKAGVNYQETNNTTNNVQISGADLAKVTALVTQLLGRQATGRTGTTTGKVS